MSLFKFLSKKNESKDAQDVDSSLEIPPLPKESPDIYSELPSFPEKPEEKDILPPVKQAYMGKIEDAAPPEPEIKEELPPPPKFTAPLEKPLPLGKKQIPKIHIPEPEMHPKPHPYAPPPVAKMPGPEHSPFIRAYMLRKVFVDLHEMQNSIRKTQSPLIIKNIKDKEDELYEKWHKTVEALQRKLMLAERMFIKR